MSFVEEGMPNLCSIKDWGMRPSSVGDHAKVWENSTTISIFIVVIVKGEKHQGESFVLDERHLYQKLQTR